MTSDQITEAITRLAAAVIELTNKDPRSLSEQEARAQAEIVLKMTQGGSDDEPKS